MTASLDRLTEALKDRYTLERELGAGGMATVYLADDPKHHRKVALKVLRPDLAATLGPDRFLREVTIAANLQHPHILPVYDSGEVEGFLYYVMPYVEGESLRDRLAKHGELPLTDAVRILRDVADAMAAAHAKGVVHRDIKPENIMLSGRHALVADFGVAKAVSEATGRQTLTTAGVALGTPTYMAPEQAAADPHTDHRADLYAFGVTAYEMLTGQPPFVGASPQAVLAAHVTEAPVNVTQRRTTIPPALAELIMRCLAKKPADRPQSAEELLPVLEGLTTPSGGITPTGTQPAAAVERRSHPLRVAGAFVLGSIGVLVLVYVLVIQLALPGWVFVSAIALLLVGLPVMLVAGTRGRPRVLVGLGLAFGALTLTAAGYALTGAMGIGPAATLMSAGALERNDRLILADFVNRTPDSTLGLSIGAALRVDLAESPVFELVGQDALAQALSRARYRTDTTITTDLALVLAEREGIKGVIAGEVVPLGTGYVIAASVVAAADRTTQIAVRETAADDAEVIEAVDRLSKRLRERIGESLRTIRQSEGLPRVTTSSLEALRLYGLGRRVAELEGDQGRAIPLMEEAVALDTMFAAAYTRLGTYLYNQGRDRARQIDVFTRAFALRDRVSDRERYNLVGLYRWVVERDAEGAIEAYRALYDISPSSAANNLGWFYERTRNWHAAEEVYLHGIQLSPNYFRIRGNLLNTQVAAGKLDEARATLDSFVARFPDLSRSRTGPIQLAGALRDYPEWERLAREHLEKYREPGWQVYANRQLWLATQVRGKLGVAERYLRSALAIQEQQDWTAAALSTTIDLAWVGAWFRNDKGRASTLLETGLRRHLLDSVPPADRPYLQIANTWAYVGRPDRARVVLAEYEQEVPPAVRETEPFEYYVRGQVALAEGRPEEAVEQYRRWDRELSCPICVLPDLARAYDVLGERDSVLAVYQRYVDTPWIFRGGNDAWDLAPAYKRLGELYEERGDREKAIKYYGDFADLWAEADPELQPVVRDVRARIARLVGEAKTN